MHWVYIDILFFLFNFAKRHVKRHVTDGQLAEMSRTQ
jgi:hypothetical protein